MYTQLYVACSGLISYAYGISIVLWKSRALWIMENCLWCFHNTTNHHYNGGILKHFIGMFYHKKHSVSTSGVLDAIFSDKIHWIVIFGFLVKKPSYYHTTSRDAEPHVNPRARRVCGPRATSYYMIPARLHNTVNAKKRAVFSAPTAYLDT